MLPLHVEDEVLYLEGKLVAVAICVGPLTEWRGSAFNICTFWLVDALTRAAHGAPERLQRAWLVFEQMLGYANHLGLYAEETGPRGEAISLRRLHT